MPAYSHHLRDPHSTFKLAGNCFVTQVMEGQVSETGALTQAIPSLSKSYIRDWKDKLLGTWDVVQMLNNPAR